MKLSDSIKVRLREGQALVYAAEAESRGIGLAAFIRDRLDQTDRVADELASIRAAMIDMGETIDELRDQERVSAAPATAQASDGAGAMDAVKLETLLLLRAIAGPQDLGMVMAEVERQGFTPWKPKETHNAPRR
jgi:hypothetical protein